ncbi:phage tail protein [Yersinia mollaretii]|nr:phage tail protein [Yersinia mollaretii]
MSVTAASATATFTADELIVQESLGGRQYKLTSFNKTINLATIGAGGMDTGTAPVTGFVALYAIYNPTTQVSALLAVNATSVLAPEVYGGANMPANYTASALVSVWATTAARLLNIGFQRGRKINIPRIVVITTTTPPSTATSLSLATAVPKNAIEVSGYASIAGASLNSSIIVLSANSNAAGLIQVSAAFSATTNQNIGTFAMTLDVPQAIYWNYSQAGGTLDNTGLSVSTYTF